MIHLLVTVYLYLEPYAHDELTAVSTRSPENGESAADVVGTRARVVNEREGREMSTNGQTKLTEKLVALQKTRNVLMKADFCEYRKRRIIYTRI